jgi:hypothetical protein
MNVFNLNIQNYYSCGVCSLAVIIFFKFLLLFQLRGVSSPLHKPENGLARFSLHILSLKGRILSDSSIITSILLVDCLLDDTRFKSDSKIKRLMERKPENCGVSGTAVEGPFRSMIDMTYQQKGSEMFGKFCCVLSYWETNIC